MHFIVPGSAIWVLAYPPGSTKSHVWFILTNPDKDNKVLATMLCTRGRNSDCTCIFAVGEYDFGNPVEGVIDYRETRALHVSFFVNKIKRGEAKTKTSLTPDQLARVTAGVTASGFTPQDMKDYLTGNG